MGIVCVYVQLIEIVARRPTQLLVLNFPEARNRTGGSLGKLANRQPSMYMYDCTGLSISLTHPTSVPSLPIIR